MIEKSYTRAQAAKILNVAAETINKYIEKGLLTNCAPIQDGKQFGIRISESELEALRPHIGDIESIEQKISEYKAAIQEEYDATCEDYKVISKFGVFRGGFYHDMPSILEAMFSFCDPLQERQKDILTDALKGYTLEEIADKHQLTRERIRQILAKASRIVHKECFSLAVNRYNRALQENENLRIENGLIRKEYEENLAKLAKYEECRNIITQIDNQEQSIKKESETIKLLLTSIRDAQFSTRCYSVAKCAEIYTIAELIGTEKEELMHFRSFGNRSFREMEEFLEKNGLCFGMDLTKYGFIRSSNGKWKPTSTVLDAFGKK